MIHDRVLSFISIHFQTDFNNSEHQSIRGFHYSMYASYADDGKTLGGSVHTIKGNAEALGVSSKD